MSRASDQHRAASQRFQQNAAAAARRSQQSSARAREANRQQFQRFLDSGRQQRERDQRAQRDRQQQQDRDRRNRQARDQRSRSPVSNQPNRRTGVGSSQPADVGHDALCAVDTTRRRIIRTATRLVALVALAVAANSDWGRGLLDEGYTWSRTVYQERIQPQIDEIRQDD